MALKVIAYNEPIECIKAVKGSNWIELYDEDGRIFKTFGGILDFSGYSIEGGDWSKPEPTREDQIEAQVTYTAMMTDTLI